MDDTIELKELWELEVEDYLTPDNFPSYLEKGSRVGQGSSFVPVYTRS